MRTDRTHLCGHCGTRFPPVSHCPRCGGARVYNIAVSRKRRNALRTLRRSQSNRPLRAFDPWIQRYFQMLPLAALVCGVAAASMGLFWATLLGGGLGGAAAVLGLEQLWRQRRARQSGPLIPSIALLPPPTPAPQTARITARGTLRLLAPVTSPLSGQACAAFRICGRGPTGELDEAGIGRFEVVGDPDGTLLVDTHAATVALEVAGKPTSFPRMRRPRLARDIYSFMRNRGACPHLGDMELTEALLRDGDPVEVSGSVELIATPSGYRDTNFRRRLAELPGAPVIVRRADD